MRQLSLFEDDQRLARVSDPDTSKAAAAEITPKLGQKQQEVLAVIRRSRSTLTANEAAEVARRSAHGKCMSETYRKRLGELERMGLVRVVGKRACCVTGKTVQHYEAT